MLKATRAGVPMVVWPMYAEHKMNRIVMVEEMKLALPMDEIERVGNWLYLEGGCRKGDERGWVITCGTS